MIELNSLDKLISWVSPKAGLKRASARQMQEVLMSYEAARPARRQGGWNTTGASGNAEIGPALRKVRDNARDLARNNAYGRRAVREWAKRVVGYGITPQADSGNPDLNAKVDAWWNRWVKQCSADRRMNFYGAQSLVVSTAFVSGEVLVRLWDRRVSDGLAVPFQIQIMEPDFLDSDKTSEDATGYCIQGVQFDKIGRITGYWLYGSHPGDVVRTSARGLSSRFIPADYILHHFEQDRPGDARGISKLAAVIAKLRDIHETADAILMRKKIEACLAMFVGQSEGVGGPTIGPVTTADGQTVEGFQPGMVVYGQPGQKPEFFAPNSTGDWAEHKKAELREVASGTEIPYTLLADDLSDVNYSSFRGGAIAFRDAIENYRWNWFIPQVLDPIYEKFIQTLKLMGEVPESVDVAVKWNPPPFELLDREAEAKADQLELQLGKQTWPQLVGNQGLDPQKQIAEISEWKPKLDSAGVSFTPNPQAVQNNEGNNKAPGSAN